MAGDAQFVVAMNKPTLLKFSDRYAEEKASYHIRFELYPEMPLKQAPLLWEAVSTVPNTFALVNPELLVCKEQAFRFVESRVKDMLRLRLGALAEAEQIRDLIAELEGKLQKGSTENPPPGFEAWRLNGPNLFYHPEQFGTVNWEVNSAQIQAHAAQPGVHHDDTHGRTLYWRDQKEVWEREVKAKEAHSKLNVTYLQAKLEAVEAFVNKITEGADRLLTEFLRGQTFLGAAPTDLEGAFLDKEINIVEKEAKLAAMPELELSYDGDEDDVTPSDKAEPTEVLADGDDSDSSDGIPQTDEYLP